MVQIIIVNEKGIKLDDYNSDIVPMIGDIFIEKWETDKLDHYTVTSRLLSASSFDVYIGVKKNG